MMAASAIETIFADAVTPTSPASEPFIIVATSTCPPIRHDIAIATSPPKAPEIVVATMIAGTSLVSPSVEPPLNPNQPSQRMNTPSVTMGIS